MNRSRLESLRKALIKNELDAILITKKENVFYLSDFQGGGVLLIAADGSKHFITNAIFAQQAREELKGFKIDLIDGSWVQVLKKFIKGAKIKYLGFESEWISHQGFSRLTASLRKIKLVPKKDLIENMRMIKDKLELSYLRKAVFIVKKAFFYIKDIIKQDLTEEGLAVKIDNFLRSNGAQRSAFQTIVAGSPKSSYPHASVSSKKLENKGAVLIDMGCVYKGYHSDLTRMLIPGKIGAKFKSIYNIVKAAQDKALKRIKPGMLISEIDNKVRQHIVNKGLGKFFIHCLGHGIGLEIHEKPRISKKNKRFLKPGMVFTVEPGVYIPGWGGVRLEDMVLVTETGCEVLTDDIPK